MSGSNTSMGAKEGHDTGTGMGMENGRQAGQGMRGRVWSSNLWAFSWLSGGERKVETPPPMHSMQSLRVADCGHGTRYCRQHAHLGCVVAQNRLLRNASWATRACEKCACQPVHTVLQATCTGFVHEVATVSAS